MGIPVTAEDPPGARRIHPGQSGRRDQQKSAQPGRYKARRIVQTCSRCAKILIFLISVSQHGVHGVDGLVYHTADRASQCQVEERRDDAVCCILGDSLHSRADDSFPVQILRVAAYDHRYRPARLLLRKGHRLSSDGLHRP